MANTSTQKHHPSHTESKAEKEKREADLKAEKEKNQELNAEGRAAMEIAKKAADIAKDAANIAEGTKEEVVKKPEPLSTPEARKNAEEAKNPANLPLGIGKKDAQHGPFPVESLEAFQERYRESQVKREKDIKSGKMKAGQGLDRNNLPPLSANQAYFEAPDGRILTGDAKLEQLWDADLEGGRGGFIFKMR